MAKYIIVSEISGAIQTLVTHPSIHSRFSAEVTKTAKVFNTLEDATLIAHHVGGTIVRVE